MVGAVGRVLRWVLIAMYAFAGPSFAADESQPKPSAAFERFRHAFFDDWDERNGIDTDALLKLEGYDRALAEEMLLRTLPKLDEKWRVVVGLGLLRSRRAVPTLAHLYGVEREDQPAGLSALTLAKALWRITRDPRWLAGILETLAKAEETQRQMAVEELADVYDPAVVQPLIAALDDPASLVRYHAAAGLLSIHGVPFETGKPGCPIYQVMKADPEIRAAGKRYVLGAIDGRPLRAP